MDKPTTLSVKNFLIRKMAAETMIPEKIIEKVISHQFAAAQEAMLIGNSVEISGFGKFIFKKKRARDKMMFWETQLNEFMLLSQDETVSKIKRGNALLRIERITENIKILKNKLL